MSSMNKVFKRSANIVYSCKYPIIWCPKYRRKVLVDAVATRLEEIIRQTIDEKQIEIIEMEKTPALAAYASGPDHVRLLCEIHPQYGVHLFGRLEKGRSSDCHHSARSISPCEHACLLCGPIHISSQQLEVLRWELLNTIERTKSEYE